MITDSEIKALADIEQEFRELSVYLDDLSQQKNRDAGHLWIAFIDKFQAFQKRVLSGAKKEDIPSKESQKQSLIELMEADQRDGIYGVRDLEELRWAFYEAMSQGYQYKDVHPMRYFPQWWSKMKKELINQTNPK